EPEGELADAHLEMPLERLLPECGQIAPRGERFVLGELAIPPGNSRAVQPAPELLSDPEESLLVGQLEAKPGTDELRIEIPLQARKRLHTKTVRAEVIEPLRLRAVRQLGAGGAAGGIPDGLDVVGARDVEGEVPAGPRQFDPGRATVDLGVVGFE